MKLDRRTMAAALAVMLAATTVTAWHTTSAATAAEYRAVFGSGSTWAADAVEQWSADVRQFGISAGYSAIGSSTARREFSAGSTDFAVSEVPYGLRSAQGGYDAPPARAFTYVPVVAGGTALAYNLTVGGRRVTNLRLSSESITKIFTGIIGRWNHPTLQQENPGIALPDLAVERVVRADASGTTYQFSAYMSSQNPDLWDAYCTSRGLPGGSPCTAAVAWPDDPAATSRSGSLAVSSHVAAAHGAITYVEHSYALRANLPVAKVRNSSGFHITPTENAVAVALLSARINDDAASRDTYQTQILDGVYRSADPRSYPLSAYAYMAVPTAESATFGADKGLALADFLHYSMCAGQQAAGALGYGPLPKNLVQAGLAQAQRIPGADAAKMNLSSCNNNPTFSPDGTSTLEATAPYPPDCDRAGPGQCGADGVTVEPAPVVVVLPATPDLEGLLTALAATTPGLRVADVDRVNHTFTVPACQQGAAPLPAAAQDFQAMLAGLAYGTVSGASAPPLPPSCRPQSVTTAARPPA